MWYRPLPHRIHGRRLHLLTYIASLSSEPPILQIFNESNEEIPLTLGQANTVLSHIARQEQVSFSFVELVYVDETEIIRINKEHLDRDYITDIISFRYDEGEETDDHSAIEGTLFCCAPRIKEQATEFEEPVDKEFMRIYIHGLLHLSGYEDDTSGKKNAMTKLENKYLEVAEFNK